MPIGDLRRRENTPTSEYDAPFMKLLEFKDAGCWIPMAKSSCLEMAEKKKKLRYQMKCHFERTKRLAQPKKIQIETSHSMPTKKVPLCALIPRLHNLAKPKIVTPKYQKPEEEPFEMPGRVTDWQQHEKWLEQRAAPRRDFSNSADKICASSTSQKTITCEGLERVFKLAVPKKRFHRCRSRKKRLRCYLLRHNDSMTICRRNVCFDCNIDCRSTTDSSLEQFCASKSRKVRFECEVQCRPLTCHTDSTSEQSCHASERRCTPEVSLKVRNFRRKRGLKRKFFSFFRSHSC